MEPLIAAGWIAVGVLITCSLLVLAALIISGRHEDY